MSAQWMIKAVDILMSYPQSPARENLVLVRLRNRRSWAKNLTFYNPKSMLPDLVDRRDNATEEEGANFTRLVLTMACARPAPDPAIAAQYR